MMCGFIFICALVGIVFANGIVYYVTKVYTVDKICSHPELSDEKVKAISEMIKTPYKIPHFFRKKK